MTFLATVPTPTLAGGLPGLPTVTRTVTLLVAVGALDR